MQIQSNVFPKDHILVLDFNFKALETQMTYT